MAIETMRHVSMHTFCHFSCINMQMGSLCSCCFSFTHSLYLSAAYLSLHGLSLYSGNRISRADHFKCVNTNEHVAIKNIHLIDFAMDFAQNFNVHSYSDDRLFAVDVVMRFFLSFSSLGLNNY